MVDATRSRMRREQMLKCADGSLWDGLRNTASNAWQSVKDTTSNTYDALSAGQVPIPYVTVGTAPENKPITAPKGEPVYIGMAGADPATWSNYAQAFRDRDFNFTRAGDNRGFNNTLGFRWFDRAQARRAIEQYAKDHPVYAFGESYGGSAVTDAVRGAKGSVEGMVLYDPVGWGKVTAPTNVRNKVVNVQPVYENKYDLDNVIATIGGRNPSVSGSTNVVHRGDYGPQSDRSTACHGVSEPATARAINGMEYDRKQQWQPAYARHTPPLSSDFVNYLSNN